MTDTTPEAEYVLIEVFRRMTPAEKWRQIGMLYRTAQILAEAGLRQHDSSATADDIRRSWMARTLSPDALETIGKT